MSGWDVPSQDGAELLDDVRSAVRKFCVLPSDVAYDAVVLWIAATYCTDAFDYATRLVIRSPEKRSGKTRLMEVVSELSYRPLRAMNATVPAIFRSLGGDGPPPTLLIDEADTIFGSRRVAEQNEDLRGLLNAGYQRGTPVLRTVGPQHTPTEFPVFAMTALAGIGTMPDTIEDRAVIIAMRRRKPSESVQPYRIRRDRPELETTAARLSEWAVSQTDTLAHADPAMPVEDRAADTWEPLVALADAAGGHWPTSARKACKVMTSEAVDAESDDSLNVKLLVDIAAVFAEHKVSFIRSQVLVEYLHAVEESPWRDFELNPNKLSRRLRDYRVRPGQDTTGNERGYRREDFTDAFDRYLPAMRPKVSEPSEILQSQAESSDTSRSSDTSNRQTAIEVSDGNDCGSSESDTSDGFGHAAGSDLGLGHLPGRCSGCEHHVETQGHRDGCSQAVAS